MKADTACLSWERICQAFYNTSPSDINLKTVSPEFNIDETGLSVHHT